MSVNLLVVRTVRNFRFREGSAKRPFGTMASGRRAAVSLPSGEEPLHEHPEEGDSSHLRLEGQAGGSFIAAVLQLWRSCRPTRWLPDAVKFATPLRP